MTMMNPDGSIQPDIAGRVVPGEKLTGEARWQRVCKGLEDELAERLAAMKAEGSGQWPPGTAAEFWSQVILPSDHAQQREYRPRPAWVSLPCVEFQAQESSLAAGARIVPIFYEADVRVEGIGFVAQVMNPEMKEHAPSAICLTNGGMLYCTLTRQRLRKRLGIFIEEVGS